MCDFENVLGVFGDFDFCPLPSSVRAVDWLHPSGQWMGFIRQGSGWALSAGAVDGLHPSGQWMGFICQGSGWASSVRAVDWHHPSGQWMGCFYDPPNEVGGSFFCLVRPASVRPEGKKGVWSVFCVFFEISTLVRQSVRPSVRAVNGLCSVQRTCPRVWRFGT